MKDEIIKEFGADGYDEIQVSEAVQARIIDETAEHSGVEFDDFAACLL